MDKVYDRWRSRSLAGSKAWQTPHAHTAPHMATAQSARDNLVRQQNLVRERMGTQPAQAPQPGRASSSLLNPATRQRLMEKASAKPQSLSDVKSMLSSAFNRDI